MANRTRFRARGLAALVGKITVKHSSGEGSSSGKTKTASNTTQHSRRRKG